MINVILGRIVRNNVFNKCIEGDTMYKYEFDDSIVEGVKSTFEKSIKNYDIVDFVNKINKINDCLFYDKDVHEFLTGSNHSSFKMNGGNLGKIMINNLYAFNDGDVQSFIELDKSYINQLKSIEFEIKLLDKVKRKSIDDFSFNNVIKIVEKKKSLESEISRINYEIENCNKDISEKESEFCKRLSDFLNELKNNGIKEYTNYDDILINAYKNYQLINLMDNTFANMDRESVSSILKDDSVKMALKNMYQEVLNRYMDHVGADS